MDRTRPIYNGRLAALIPVCAQPWTNDVTQNIGDADRTIRMLIAAILGVIFFALPRSPAEVAVGVVTVLLLLAALTGWSLLYFVLRITTRSDKDAKPLEPT